MPVRGYWFTFRFTLERYHSGRQAGRLTDNFSVVLVEPLFCKNLVHSLYHPGGHNPLTLTKQRSLSVSLDDGCFLSLWENCSGMSVSEMTGIR